MIMLLLLLLLRLRLRDVTGTASRAWATTTHADGGAAEFSEPIRCRAATPLTEPRIRRAFGMLLFIVPWLFLSR